jgi:uncharacterized protein YlaI
MVGLREKLKRIAALLEANWATTAERMLRDTLRELSQQDIRATERQIQRLIDRFEGKERRPLTRALTKALSRRPGNAGASGGPRDVLRPTEIQCGRCKRMVAVQQYKQHVKTACAAVDECPSCKRSVSIDELAKHVSEGCPEYCDACAMSVPKNRLVQHRLRDCPVLTRQCPDCRRRVALEHWRGHQDNHAAGINNRGGSARGVSGGLPTLGGGSRGSRGRPRISVTPAMPSRARRALS